MMSRGLSSSSNNINSGLGRSTSVPIAVDNVDDDDSVALNDFRARGAEHRPNMVARRSSRYSTAADETGDDTQPEMKQAAEIT